MSSSRIGFRLGPAWCHGTRRFVAVGRASMLVWVLVQGTAWAQSPEVGELSRQLSDLQRDLSRLQQYVYSSPSATAGRSETGPLDLSPAYRQRVEVRLAALERELRSTTGRIEEVSFAIRQLEDRLEKLVEDVEFRLTALERGAPGPAGAASTEIPGPISADRTAGEDGSDTPSGQPGSSDGETSSDVASLPSGSAAAQYQQAQRLLAQSKFDDAEASLRSFLEQYPDNQLAENARYWLGETYYVRKRYEEAASTFLEGYKRHPEGTKAPDNLLKLGLSLAALGKQEEACVAINKLLRDYPDSADHIRQRGEQERQKLDCA